MPPTPHRRRNGAAFRPAAADRLLAQPALASRRRGSAPQGVRADGAAALALACGAAWWLGARRAAGCRAQRLPGMAAAGRGPREHRALQRVTESPRGASSSACAGGGTAVPCRAAPNRVARSRRSPRPRSAAGRAAKHRCRSPWPAGTRAEREPASSRPRPRNQAARARRSRTTPAVAASEQAAAVQRYRPEIVAGAP